MASKLSTMSFDTDLTNRSDATYLLGTQGTVGISLEYCITVLQRHPTPFMLVEVNRQMQCNNIDGPTLPTVGIVSDGARRPCFKAAQDSTPT